MQYHQLSPEAKSRARDWYRESCIADSEWWECDYEYWKEELEKRGFADANIKFEGFGCQGHGASFTADITREFKLPAELLTRLSEAESVARVLLRFDGKHRDPEMSWECHAKIKRDIRSRYVHANTIDAHLQLEFGRDVPDDLRTALEAWFEEEEKSLTEQARELSDKIYRSLESTYDDIISDDSIEENIIANEFHFDGSGDLIPHPHQQPDLKLAA